MRQCDKDGKIESGHAKKAKPGNSGRMQLLQDKITLINYSQVSKGKGEHSGSVAFLRGVSEKAS